jgi:hypothetical protein
MQPENWKAIEISNTIARFEDAEKLVLDKVQARLNLSDREFLDFLLSAAKVAPCVARLKAVHLPKP